MSIHKPMAVLAILLFTTSAYSQDFTLFEPVDSPQQDQQQQVDRPPRDGQRSAEPEFVLTGTARIGDAYHAILTHRSGELVVIRSQPNQVTPIAGYEQYTVTEVGQGRVVMNFPAGFPCQDATDKGVACRGSGQGELRLVNSAPLQRTTAPADPNQQVGPDGIVDSVDSAEPVNPFAALRARAQGLEEPAVPQAGNIDGGPQRFVPRRISPEDVPPGMRVISTPFGDRLVEQ